VIQTNLVVTIDTRGPRVVGMTPTNTAAALVDHIDVTFDTAIAAATLNAGALSLERAFAGLVAVNSISALGGNTYRLGFAPLAGGVYSLTVASTVTDLAGNVVTAPNDRARFHSFAFRPGLLTFHYFNNIGGTAVGGMTSDPRFPDEPTATYYTPVFDSRYVFPDDSHENYGGRITGVFVPTVSGNYLFYLASDDASQLYLNPAGTDPGCSDQKN